MAEELEVPALMGMVLVTRISQPVRGNPARL